MQLRGRLQRLDPATTRLKGREQRRTGEPPQIPRTRQGESPSPKPTFGVVPQAASGGCRRSLCHPVFRILRQHCYKPSESPPAQTKSGKTAAGCLGVSAVTHEDFCTLCLLRFEFSQSWQAGIRIGLLIRDYPTCLLSCEKPES